MKAGMASTYAEALYEACRQARGSEVARVVEKFVLLMRRRHLTRLIPAVSVALAEHARKTDNLTPVLLETKQAMSDEAARKLLSACGLDVSRLQITTRSVPELLGGLRLRVGDRLIDGSLRHRLASLRHKLES